MTITTKLNSQELLSRLASSQSSGCLELNEGQVSWKIYLQQGNLKYIYCSAQLLEQLKYYLHCLGLKQAAVTLKHSPISDRELKSSVDQQFAVPDLYSQAMSWLLAEKHLTSSQLVKLIELITKDALQYCIWLDQGISLWHKEHSLPLWLKAKLANSPSLSLSECLNVEQTRLQQWQSCSAKLLSVHQRPYLTSNWRKKTLPLFGSLDHQALQQLSKVINGRTSIRQLSLLLQKDELDVAQTLSPYIDDEIIYLRNAQPTLHLLPSIPRAERSIQQSSSIISSTEGSKKQNNVIKTWKIVCIDDSPTILKEIQRFLAQENFEVTAIEDPTQAASKIFTLNPDLILLDITMPRINGYELCGLLRKSGKCDRTPVIMVTGNNGIINKARAKIAGASDYFTKPFTQQGLIEIMEKHLK